MLLRAGDNILVSHRRLFETDHARYFVGQVEEYDDGIVRATGYTYVMDQMSGRVIGKDEPRTKLFAVGSGTLIVHVLPEEATPQIVSIITQRGRLVLTDGKHFAMNLTEDSRGDKV